MRRNKSRMALVVPGWSCATDAHILTLSAKAAALATPHMHGKSQRSWTRSYKRQHTDALCVSTMVRGSNGVVCCSECLCQNNCSLQESTWNAGLHSLQDIECSALHAEQNGPSPR